MKNFEYAAPRTEREMLQLLADSDGTTALLAGGTDLIGLMKAMVVTPDRVVDLTRVESMRAIEVDEHDRIWIGAMVSLDSFRRSSLTDIYPAAKQVIQGVSSIQLQAQGTLVGELLQRPRCWYFRAGHGLLADLGRRVVEGDSRYHAILGNSGPAKFVSSSRLAPALIALGAQVRLVGPDLDAQRMIPLADVYRTPQREQDRETVLSPREVVTHVVLPPDDGRLSAAYEVRHGEGPDPPLAAAAANLRVERGRIQQALIVLGQVAPIPWISAAASSVLVGQPLNERAATTAGDAAVAGATPLRDNDYKVQLAAVAVKRAILRAAGLDVGGFV
jgi:xanthine dehydrogenase YagS FAD-binding subunit